MLYMSGWLSKIRSIHTYVMIRTVYFDWICRSKRNFYIVAKLLPVFLNTVRSQDLTKITINNEEKLKSFSQWFHVRFRGKTARYCWRNCLVYKMKSNLLLLKNIETYFISIVFFSGVYFWLILLYRNRLSFANGI